MPLEHAHIRRLPTVPRPTSSRARIMGPHFDTQRYSRCYRLLLAVAAYYPAQLHGKPLPSLEGDASLYAYQLMRAAECHGQWWHIVKDARLGHPYPTEFAKHPGLFEGVDLMLLAALTAGSLGTTATYHLAVLVALLVNGWIAAWIVLRFTRSALWAAMAVILITLNQSVGVRILGHLHLFKFGWILLSVWAFVCFLDRPDASERAGSRNCGSPGASGFILLWLLHGPQPGHLVLERDLGGAGEARSVRGGGRRRPGLCDSGQCSLLSRLDRLVGDRRQQPLFSARLGGNLGLWLGTVEVFRTQGNLAGQFLLARRASSELYPH